MWRRGCGASRAAPVDRYRPDGPEPPRPTDLDPRQADEHDSFLDEVLVADPAAPTGVGEALLKLAPLWSTGRQQRGLQPTVPSSGC
ncbi:hypothetical protein E1182_27430 [Micromonospora sp. KC721]|nr:hypothetical protein E1182_27430 [Micromonospora sp. KC721]